MNLLFTGRGCGGSFQIRGQQLGDAIGATVRPRAKSSEDADVVVIVKRSIEKFDRRNAKLVWDIVDSWPQPDGNDWTQAQCMEWLHQAIKSIRPDGIVAATQAMQRDIATLGHQSFYLPHHARPGIAINPIRKKVRTVGYEGGGKYITKWRHVIERECTARGWRFVVNPDQLADVDIVLGLRDATGYAPRHFKSNVKLANSQGSGTPCIMAREAGYLETACGAERWCDTSEELAIALDSLHSHDDRLHASERLLAAAPKIERVAQEYREWLGTFA